MSLLRVYLVDDELLALQRLSRLLQASGRVEIIGSHSDPETALQELGLALSPARDTAGIDVLFLDIQMPGLNGFELLQALPVQPLVIFTTAYDQYALRAFEVNSIDYLLKPIDVKQLSRALTKVEVLHASVLKGAAPPDLSGLLKAPSTGEGGTFPTRLASRLGGRVQFVPLAQVTHFVARNKLTYAVTAQKEHVVDFSIAELEAKLDPARFTRVHRSILLNIDAIHELHSILGGRALIVLSDAKRTQVPVSRDRLPFLRARLDF